MGTLPDCTSVLLSISVVTHVTKIITAALDHRTYRTNVAGSSKALNGLSSHQFLCPISSVATMALDSFFYNKIESMKLEIIQGQAVLRRLEAQRNDYNSRVRLLREELGLLQQPGSYVGEVVKVMGTKKVLVKVHPEGKYGTSHSITSRDQFG